MNNLLRGRVGQVIGHSLTYFPRGQAKQFHHAFHGVAVEAKQPSRSSTIVAVIGAYPPVCSERAAANSAAIVLNNKQFLKQSMRKTSAPKALVGKAFRSLFRVDTGSLSSRFIRNFGLFSQSVSSPFASPNRIGISDSPAFFNVLPGVIQTTQLSLAFNVCFSSVSMVGKMAFPLFRSAVGFFHFGSINDARVV